MISYFAIRQPYPPPDPKEALSAALPGSATLTPSMLSALDDATSSVNTPSKKELFRISPWALHDCSQRAPETNPSALERIERRPDPPKRLRLWERGANHREWIGRALLLAVLDEQNGHFSTVEWRRGEEFMDSANVNVAPRTRMPPRPAHTICGIGDSSWYPQVVTASMERARKHRT